MPLTSLVAIYAALVATGAVIWQVVSWQLSRRTRVEVIVSPGMFRGEGQPVREAAGVLFVDAVNHGDHAVRVANVRVCNKHSTKETARQASGASIPGVILSHGMGQTWFRDDELSDVIVQNEPLWAEVRLAGSARVYRSRPLKPVKPKGPLTQ